MIGYYTIHYKNGEIVHDFEDYYNAADFIKFVEIISQNDDISFVTVDGIEDE